MKPGGFLFTILAYSIGIEHLIQDKGDERLLPPDGPHRFLMNEQTLHDFTRELNGKLFEPIKTTNVQKLRCMTIWCLRNGTKQGK